MQDHSPILSLPLIQPSQAQKHVTHNEALRLLDALVQLTVQDRDRTGPPGDPSPGERHIVAAGATGAWAGADMRIAIWEEVNWSFLDPLPGWRAEVLSEQRMVVFDGESWAARPPDLDNLSGVGVNAVADPINRLTTAAPATLLNHEGAGHQLKVNKASVADTASLLYQTGFSGRAEMGTAGNDDWSIKVSPDGATWVEALRVAAATGLVTGQAVQSSPTDATVGRLLRSAENGGPFGLGKPVQESGDWNNLTAPGFYFINNGVTNQPIAGHSWSVIVMQGLDDNNVTQLASNNKDASMIYLRSRDSGVWGNWRRLDGLYGSGPNGEFVRLSDGTQICWHRINLGSITAAGAGTLANPYRTVSQNWTYPAEFASGTIPEVLLTAEYTGSQADVRRVASPSKGARNRFTQLNVQAWRWSTVSDPDEFIMTMMAVGRWF